MDEVSTLISLLLIFIQIARRFYESAFLQIFAKTSKLNLFYVVFGFVYYFVVISAIVANSPGFVRDSSFSGVSLGQLMNIRIILWSMVFIYAWTHQFLSNLILVSLRKNRSGKWLTLVQSFVFVNFLLHAHFDRHHNYPTIFFTGNVVTEKHLMPRGGYFELVSAPHMLFEIAMYIALTGILYGNWYIFFLMIFVAFNQSTVAYLNHTWYKETFPEYPKSRRIIIPYVL